MRTEARRGIIVTRDEPEFEALLSKMRSLGVSLLLPEGRIMSHPGPRVIRGSSRTHSSPHTGTDVSFGRNAQSRALLAPFSGIYHGAHSDRDGTILYGQGAYGLEWPIGLRFGHVSGVRADLMNSPKFVGRGEPVALDGDTGCSSTGPHLHIDFYVQDEAGRPVFLPVYGLEHETYQPRVTDVAVRSWWGKSCRINARDEASNPASWLKAPATIVVTERPTKVVFAPEAAMLDRKSVV